MGWPDRRLWPEMAPLGQKRDPVRGPRRINLPPPQSRIDLRVAQRTDEGPNERSDLLGLGLLALWRSGRRRGLESRPYRLVERQFNPNGSGSLFSRLAFGGLAQYGLPRLVPRVSNRCTSDAFPRPSRAQSASGLNRCSRSLFACCSGSRTLRGSAASALR
jgi:hypothetical protein